MFLKSGYNDAVVLTRKKLENLSPDKVCKLCGVNFHEDKYIIRWMSKEYELLLNANVSPDYSQAMEIIFLHYLTSEGTKQPEGKLISYREVPGALFYEPKFIQRAVNPIIRCFGKNPERLVEIGERFGGVKSNEGDASVKINLLPYLSVTYIIWSGDDEFEPAGTILFDRTAYGWLDAEDLVVAASFGAYELVGEYKKLYN